MPKTEIPFMVNDAQRRRFDDLLDRVIEQLPDDLTELLEELPLIVEDEPTPRLMRELGLDQASSELCGLHHGVALPHRSVEAPPRVPDRMMIFRGPILRLSRMRGQSRTSTQAEAVLVEQIRVTVLHEMGHHFGLDEDDLARLGYA